MGRPIKSSNKATFDWNLILGEAKLLLEVAEHGGGGHGGRGQSGLVGARGSVHPAPLQGHARNRAPVKIAGVSATFKDLILVS